ncbi:hypothetical protein CWI38_0246p0050 [Hamiltosporidium tvaerminnensis]|uniref:USP domain-containing protein n=1 Tax=Hamiltosporidium tvaerminnensis TaxID=1176355 RepID=A0A4Q9LZ37_9MICR|nr:hypothetical protein CWI38_0246p0050 [Hamiltosporidium tvaerminnensis]
MKVRRAYFTLFIIFLISELFQKILLFYSQKNVITECTETKNYILYEKRYESAKRSIVGLKNDNFVCYFNSLIQALYFQNDFMKGLFLYEHTKEQKCIFILKELFEQMLNDRIVNTSVYLKEILELDSNMEYFKFGCFEDAGTCLDIIFLRILKEIDVKKFSDLNNVTNKYFPINLYLFQMKTTYLCVECLEKNIIYGDNYNLVLYLENSIQESINKSLNVESIQCYKNKFKDEIHYAKILREFVNLPSSIIIKNTHDPSSNGNVLIDEEIIVQNQKYSFKVCVFYVKDLHYYTVAVLGNNYYELNDNSVKKLNIESIENLGFSDIPDILFYEKLNSKI